jgi:hypothetical protein
LNKKEYPRFETTKVIVENFIDWLDKYGPCSFDHQSYFAGPIGGAAKALYYKQPILGMVAVSPMILSEAFFPSARKLFWKKLRFPIADAHYAMGFAFLYNVYKEDHYYHQAVKFLKSLIESRSPGYDNYCWGYPFNWVTRSGTFKANTPFITSTPYMYEAFRAVYQIDQDDKWKKIMKSIAEHAVHDIKDFKLGENESTCSYSPLSNDQGGVVNASAYRSLLLTLASEDLDNNDYWKIAEKNLNFVLNSQQSDGAWFYAIDDVRDFVDHYHTCFVMKALAKIEKIKNHKGCHDAIDRGVKYYTTNLFDELNLPKPFSKPPRLTVYKRELYDYAECINLGVLLWNRFPEFDTKLNAVLNDVKNRWVKRDGSFRSRELFFGWDNIPMHRWAQSQLFRSLAFYISRAINDPK